MVNITNGRSDNSASLDHPINGSSTYLIMPKRSSRRHANRLAATSFVTNTANPDIARNGTANLNEDD